MTLPEIAVKKPIGTLMALISILVLGIIALFKLELAFMPESEQRNLFVVVNYPNASPKAIERMIVKPIEESLASMNGLEHMWSNSDSRGGRINLNFSFNVNMALARVEIHERLDRIKDELPEDLERIVISENWNPRESGETIMEARLSSGRDLSKNYDLLDRKIVKPLERIAGVAVVSLDGVNPREVRINLDLQKLKRHRIDARSVWRDIAQNNQNAAIGVVRNSQSKVLLRSVGAFKTADEIGRLPLTGSQLRLSDVAEISYEEPPLEYGRHLDGDFAIGLNVAKESSANTITITDAVYQKIDEMQNDPELDGINFLVWQDQGKEIRNTLGDLEQTGFFGAILATIVLFLFLRKVSTTIVAVACIPFSLIVACGVIWLQGKSLNTISLLGLIVGLGMLVDNAVVVMENIDRYQKKGYDGRVAAILGSKEVSIAVMTATLTSLIVFLPMIFSKPTNMNIVLQELGLTICITLIASLVISQTLIPLASTRLLKKKKTVTKTPIMDWLQKVYSRILGFTLKHRWMAVVSGFGVLLATIYPVKNINFNFDAAPTEMFVGIRIDISEPMSLQAKEALVTRVEKSLAPYKEQLNIKSIYSWWSEQNSITRLYMKQGFQNEEEMNKVRRQLPELLPVIPGVKLQVQDNGPFWRRNSGKRVAVRLNGPDTETLGELSEKALLRIENIPGLFDFYSTAEGGRLELHAELDRDRMSGYGVASNQPASLVEMTFRGRNLPRFKSENGEVEMRLLLGEDQDTHVSDVKNLTLEKSDGSAIALDSISNFATRKGPGRIQRQNKVSSIWVGARFEEGKRKEYHKQIVELLKDMPLPTGYQWQFNNRWRGAEQSQEEFVLNLLLALGLIFAVMASLFESMRQAIALMISLPFALAGAFWTLFLFGIDFDQPASVAVLLLLGIVVNNGIVMIEHINLYRREGWERSKAMIQGGKERLRPIIMTALTTLVGLIPIVIQKPSLGGVYYYSMAYVIIGGLLFSTVLTTVFLPATISLVEDTPGRVAALFRWIGSAFRRKQPASQ
ncbi:efflux RND transporter permease subunit [Aliikangiella coralliicola]|uniref:Efflux RND transporter permease subunit n=1 Tax=Aliikangiella coralliicola TaxID=2592383 RepID=A0A545U0D5_9GAMM|nr:efflux RND transporter permease subunit [Aliikangiella coralliicola]TQV82925.1 efflux RND transporter permease subunit [Aliikangiella coralliicola]